MAPFAGLKHKKMKAQPAPSTPLSHTHHDVQQAPRASTRAPLEDSEEPPSRESSSKKRSRNEDSASDVSPPPTPPPKAKQKIHFNKRVIEAYQALDHKAQEPTRIKLGFQHLYEAVRYFPRMIGQYPDYDSILTKGLVREFAYRDPEVAAGMEVEHTEELERMMYNQYWESYVCYPIIRDFLPGFSESTAYLRRKPELVCQMATFMRAVAGKARCDDASRLKKHILEFCPSLTPDEREKVKLKTRRGFKHPATGRLLCPIRLLDVFDKNPEDFCRDVRNHTKDGLKIYSTDWPLLFYDMDAYREGHDPDDPDDCLPGFMMSQTLLDSYRFTYTGMSTTSIADSAPSGKTKGKPPIARVYDQQQVTLHSICYVAALARFALNSQPEWSDSDLDFHGRKFFNAAQTLFMRNEEQANELLAWWNDQVYGESLSDPEEAPEVDTAFTRMLARDEARKAALAKEAATKATQAPQADD